MTANEEFEFIKKLPASHRPAYLRGLTRKRMLELALAGAESVTAAIQSIPGQAYDALEADLPTHQTSLDATQQLLARLTGQMPS